MADIKLPPVLTIKRNNFEKTFKILMRKIISENKIQSSELTEINRELRAWLITGMQNVDFEKDFTNNAVLDSLLDDLWKDFYRNLNLKVRKYRTKFRRR